jgi:hypothetical protein
MLWFESRHPMDAAAIPFPKDETTPPVTKMYLGNQPLRKISHQPDPNVSLTVKS